MVSHFENQGVKVVCKEQSGMRESHHLGLDPLPSPPLLCQELPCRHGMAPPRSRVDWPRIGHVTQLGQSDSLSWAPTLQRLLQVGRQPWGGEVRLQRLGSREAGKRVLRERSVKQVQRNSEKGSGLDG